MYAFMCILKLVVLSSYIVGIFCHENFNDNMRILSSTGKYIIKSLELNEFLKST